MRASRREVLRKPSQEQPWDSGDCQLGTPELAVCAAHIGGSSVVEKSRLNRGARGPEVEALAGSHGDRRGEKRF